MIETITKVQFYSVRIAGLPGRNTPARTKSPTAAVINRERGVTDHTRGAAAGTRTLSPRASTLCSRGCPE